MMSGKKFVLFISVFLLVVIAIVFYFFIGNKKDDGTPEFSDAKTPEQIRAELQAFEPDIASTKTPIQIQKELSSFKAPISSSTTSKTQILEDLQNAKP
ncbi:MAG: hypothetical protein QG583_437 [Patescibacteria group bacterium]|nr:hypothetical protein [Patescibacteria group bacterium]